MKSTASSTFAAAIAFAILIVAGVFVLAYGNAVVLTRKHHSTEFGCNDVDTVSVRRRFIVTEGCGWSSTSYCMDIVGLPYSCKITRAETLPLGQPHAMLP